MARNAIIDLSKKVVADKRFSMDDKQYQFGEEVDLSGKTMRQIERLFRHRFVRSVDEAVTPTAVGGGGKDNPPEKKPSVAPVAEPEPEAVADETPVAPVADETPVAPVTEPEAVATNTVKLHHAGGGYFEAQDANGVNLLGDKVKGKDNAKMLAEQLGFTVTE